MFGNLLFSIYLSVLIAVFIGAAPSVGSAQTLDGIQAPVLDEAKEAEIAQKAKKRLYPGGRDEEDLRVQTELSTPSRKLAPQAELKDDSSEEE